MRTRGSRSPATDETLYPWHIKTRPQRSTRDSSSGTRSTHLSSHANLKLRRLHIFGKGKKEREVRVSARTDEGHKFTRHRLGRVIAKIAERAKVRNAHPHRFRHTFAVEFIRNHGDPFTLQNLLGHTTMEMVRRYLHLAQVDLDEGHKRASPVDNWRL